MLASHFEFRLVILMVLQLGLQKGSMFGLEAVLIV